MAGATTDQSVNLRGIPTDVDVNKIEEAIGSPEPGLLVPYEMLESILGLERAKSRFHTVVNAWRKRLLRDRNLVTEGVRNVGIMVCADPRRVDYIGRRTAGGLRGLKRIFLIAATTPREELLLESARALDHQLHLLGSAVQLERRFSAGMQQIKQLGMRKERSGR